MTIDLSISVTYPDLSWPLEQSVDAFTNLLAALARTRLCDDGWTVVAPRSSGDTTAIDPFGQRSELVAWFEEREALILDGRPRVGPRTIYASSPDPTPSRYRAEFGWDSGFGTTGLMLDIRAPHPVHGLNATLVEEVVATIVTWQRPLHLAAMPTLYRSEHHPLDRLRQSVGWVGWVPFELGVEEIAPANRLTPLAGGTLVVGQQAFWQADDARAVAHAQVLDLALHDAGALPTAVELQRGDWGQ